MLEHRVGSSGICLQERVCTANWLSAAVDSVNVSCSWAASHKRTHSHDVSRGLYEKIQVEDTVQGGHSPYCQRGEGIGG